MVKEVPLGVEVHTHVCALEIGRMQALSGWGLTWAGCQACSVSCRNAAAAKAFLGLTAHSVLGASPTLATAKAT